MLTTEQSGRLREQRKEENYDKMRGGPGSKITDEEKCRDTMPFLFILSNLQIPNCGKKVLIAKSKVRTPSKIMP